MDGFGSETRNEHALSEGEQSEGIPNLYWNVFNFERSFEQNHLLLQNIRMDELKFHGRKSFINDVIVDLRSRK